MVRTVGYSRERCLLALRGYWDELDTLIEEVERLASGDREAVRCCQVQLGQVLRDVEGDLNVRDALGIVRMSDVEADCYVPALKIVRSEIRALAEQPDRDWVRGLARAQQAINRHTQLLVGVDAARRGEQTTTTAGPSA